MSIIEDRAALIGLLLDMPLGEPKQVEGLAELATADKLFMLSTCCANMIAEAVWTMALANRQGALIGLDALVAGIKDNLARRVEGDLIRQALNEKSL